MDEFRSAEALGILYAEDFGTAAPAAPPEPEPEPPPLTQHDIDEACAQAVQFARDDWAEAAAARRTRALEALAAGLADLRAQAATHAETMAGSIAQTALGMLAGVLPQLCRTHGDAETRALVATLLPLLAGPRRVVVRVHPGLIGPLQADIDAFDEALAHHVELRPANLPPGDARLSWDEGSLVRDTAEICAAMQDSLAKLGLLDPTPLAPTRSGSLALAE